MRFEPGDWGYFDDQHVLHLKGQVNNIVNIGGTKTIAEDVEEIIARAPAIADCGIAIEIDPLDVDRIVCGIVVSFGWNQELFMAHCQANLLTDLLPNRFVLLIAVPPTLNGKIDRAALRKALMVGECPPGLTPTRGRPAVMAGMTKIQDDGSRYFRIDTLDTAPLPLPARTERHPYLCFKSMTSCSTHGDGASSTMPAF